MTYTEIWEKSCKSICQFIHKKQNKIISVGSGFKVNKYILTNNHVYNPVNSDEIIIQFKDVDGKKIVTEKKYSKDEFISVLKEGLPQDSWDFAIIEDPFFASVPALKLANKNQEIKIGQDCSFLGFPFMSNYLSIHKAIISAKYTNINNNVKYIQLDGNINRGNSGGPLIDSETGNVIGIITLKKTGFSDRFNTLKESFERNLIAFSENDGMTIQFGNINLFEAFKAVQKQFDLLSSELERAINPGIGYAFEVDEIRNSILISD